MAQMDLPDIDLEGRVVIMTGADRGLGRAMSLGLAEKGARLVLASPVMDGLNAVAEEIAAIAGPGTARAQSARNGNRVLSVSAQRLPNLPGQTRWGRATY
jgi:NAD(P)-dependent dehydrogenase (short-subunit alcohol dehydrogenase family)